MEVWLLETYYNDPDTVRSYEAEVFLHLPNTDVWIADTGYFREELDNVIFTNKFWDELGKDDLFTKLGQL